MAFKHPYLSPIKASGIRKAFEAQHVRFKKKTPYDLSIGQLDLPPPPSLIHIFQDLVSEPSSYRYAPAPGLPLLRKAIRETFSLNHLPLVTLGASGALTLAMRFVIRGKRDEILIPDPGFVSFPALGHFFGGVVRTFPAQQGLSVKNILARVSSRTRALFLSSPSNPTGDCLSPNELEELSKYLKKKKIYFVLDEVYHTLIYNGIYKPPSFHPYLFRVGSFSKSLSLAGLRIGYLLAHPPIQELLLKASQFTFVSAPTLAQEGLRVFLEKQDRFWKFQSQIYTIYKKRLLFLSSRFHRSPVGGKAETILKRGGGIYLWLRVKKPSRQAAIEILRKGVVIVAGNSFGKRGERFIRVSLSLPERKLKDALSLVDSSLI